MIKHVFLIAVGIAALVLNPFFGCDGSEDFRYGADEMRAAIEGTWKLTVPAADDKPAQEIVMSISQGTGPTQQHSRRPGPVADATACAQRSMVRSAGACGDTSEMPLDVKLLAGGTATGVFLVLGTTFTAGTLTLDVDTQSIFARVSPAGVITKLEAGDHHDASLVRMTTAQP